MNQGLKPLTKVKHFSEKDKNVPYKDSNTCKLAGFLEDFYKDLDNPRYISFQCRKLGCEPFELLDQVIPYLAHRINRMPQDLRDERELERTIKRNRKITESLQIPRVQKQLKNIAYNRALNENKGYIIQVEKYRAQWIEYFKQFYRSESTIKRKAVEMVNRRFGHNPNWSNKSKETLWRNVPKYCNEIQDGEESVRKNSCAELHLVLNPYDFHRKDRKGVRKSPKKHTTIARQLFLLKRKKKVF